MALSSLASVGSRLSRFFPGLGSNIWFPSQIAAVLSQDASRLDPSLGLTIDDQWIVTFTTLKEKPGEQTTSTVTELAKLSQGTVTINEDNIDKMASTRNETIAKVVSFCLLNEGVSSVIIPATYWKNTNHPFHFNERTGALIVRSLWIPLDQVSFVKKWDTIEIRKK